MGMALPDTFGDTTSRLMAAAYALSDTYEKRERRVRRDRRPEWIVGVDRWAGPAERRPAEVVAFERRAREKRKARHKNRRRLRGGKHASFRLVSTLLGR